jgi:hypothetical protein
MTLGQVHSQLREHLFADAVNTGTDTTNYVLVSDVPE